MRIAWFVPLLWLSQQYHGKKVNKKVNKLRRFKKINGYVFPAGTRLEASKLPERHDFLDRARTGLPSAFPNQ
jgi:hypothetical protein